MQSSQSPAEHPERSFLQAVHAGGGRQAPVSTNPLAVALAMRVDRIPELGHVFLDFEVGPQFAQGDGVVQGGITAAMLDFGLAFAAMSAAPPGMTVSSIGLNVNFLRPARLGFFRVEALVEKMGRSVAVTRASLYDGEERLIASASSSLAVLPFRG